MSRNTNYTHEDKKGLHDYDVTYEIHRADGFSDVVIEAVTENGLEIKADDELLEQIRQHILDSMDDNEDYELGYIMN